MQQGQGLRRPRLAQGAVRRRLPRRRRPPQGRPSGATVRGPTSQRRQRRKAKFWNFDFLSAEDDVLALDFFVDFFFQARVPVASALQSQGAPLSRTAEVVERVLEDEADFVARLEECLLEPLSKVTAQKEKKTR